MIKAGGAKAGLVLNPGTPLTALDWLLEDCDMVLLMSVNPGYGGQRFIPSTLDKIRALRALMDQSDHPLRLEVDGGVGPGILLSLPLRARTPLWRAPPSFAATTIGKPLVPFARP